MSSEVAVTKTLAFLFPGDAAQPTVADMVRFVKAFNGDQSLMDTAYKISDEKSVFIRFKSEEAMQFAFDNNDKSLPFFYSDEKKVVVRMTVAGNTRYVRIFDLPPEISDADLKSLMEQYGKVKRTVRERFPAEFQLDLFTGVRGLYMDLEKEIPDVVYVNNRKGRVYYDGFKPKCFICKSNAHLRKSCPVRRERKSKEPQTTTVALPLEVKKAENAVNAMAGTKGKIEISKHKEVDIERQRSFESNRDVGSSSSTEKRQNASSKCAGDNSAASAELFRCSIPKYEWITDESERRAIMEDVRRRYHEVTGVPIDKIILYHD